MTLATELVIRGRVDSSLTRSTQAASTQLSRAGTGAAKATGRAAEAETRLVRATKDVDRVARRAARSTRRLSDETTRTGRALGLTARQARDASRAVREFGRSGQQARTGGGLSLGDMATSLGTAGALKKSFSASLSTEAAQVRLATAVNAEDKDAAVRDATLAADRFSRRAPVSKTQILDVNYALNSAGLTADVARAGAEAVTKVATVTNGQAEQVAEIMAGVYNNLGQTLAGPETEKMARIGDMMTRTQLKYSIRSFGQLGEGIAYASATASSAKIPMADMLVILGQLNGATVTGSRAGTSMAAVFRSLSKASRDLGFEIVRDRDGQLDYIATFEGLRDALSIFDDIDERNDKLQELFGDEGKAAVVPLLQALDRARADRADLITTLGLTDAEFQRFVNARGGQLTTIVNGLSSLGEAIADSLLPVIDRLSGPIIGLTGYMTDLIREFPALGQAIGATLAVIGGAASLRLVRGGLGLLTGGGLGLGRTKGGGKAGGLGRAGAAGLGGAGGVVPVRIVGGSLGASGPWDMGGGAGQGAGGAKTRTATKSATKLGRVAGVLGKADGLGRVAGVLGKAGGLGRVAGVLGKGARVLGRAGGPLLATATYLPEVIDAAGTGDTTRLGGALGGMGGGLAGAAAGAAIGSVVPVIGTAIGALAGGLIGQFGGEAMGSWIGSMFAKTEEKAQADQAVKEEGSGKTVTNNATTTINNNLTVPPEMNAEALARALAQKNAEQTRGALYDID